MYEQVLLARRFGKEARQKEWCDKLFALGHNVAVAKPEGLFCFNCDSLWKTCLGVCRNEKK